MDLLKSAALNLPINQEPSLPNQEVEVMFTVTSVAGVPSGDVTVTSGSATCMASTAVGNCAITFDSAGEYKIQGYYHGDGILRLPQR